MAEQGHWGAVTCRGNPTVGRGPRGLWPMEEPTLEERRGQQGETSSERRSSPRQRESNVAETRGADVGQEGRRGVEPGRRARKVFPQLFNISLFLHTQISNANFMLIDNTLN